MCGIFALVEGLRTERRGGADFITDELTPGDTGKDRPPGMRSGASGARIPRVLALWCTSGFDFSYNPSGSVRYNLFRLHKNDGLPAGAASLGGRDLMMREMTRIALVCLIVCVSLLVWAEVGVGADGGSKTETVRLPGAAFLALKTINPEHIRWHVRYLSHDLLEGRGTGQRGGDLAAEYIATQFAEYGLEPAGDHGSYMQKVPLVGITTLPETKFSLIPKQGETMNLKPLDQYVAYDQTQQAQSDVDAEILFVGYGIEAPEYHWDDYKGVDVRGKVLLMLVNEPPSDDPRFFNGKALTYYGRWTYKYEEGLRKGAAGVILIHQTEMASYPWEVVRNSNSGEKSFLKLEGPALKVTSWIPLDVASRLAVASGMNLEKMIAGAQSRDFRPINLGARLRAHMVSRVRKFESNNVLAILPSTRKA